MATWLKRIQKIGTGNGTQKILIKNKLEVNISYLKALIFSLYSLFFLWFLNIPTKIHFSANSSFSLM